MQRIKEFLSVPYRTVSVSSMFAAFVIASAGTFLLLLILLRTELIPTIPTELMGCYAYYADLPITNRLASVTISMVASFLFFHLSIVVLSLRKQQDIVHKMSAFYHRGVNAQIIERFQAIKTWGKPKHVILLLWAVGLSWFIFPAVLSAMRAYIGSFGDISQCAILERSGKIFSMFHWVPPLLVVLAAVFASTEYKIVRHVLFPVQTILLLFYCTILPAPFIKEGQISTFFPIRPVFWFLAFPLAALGLADCIYRCFASKKKRYISPLTLLALLFSFLFHNSPIPEVSNLYELGARLPIYWSVRKGWSSLFEDVSITYGLWDYVTCWLSEIFTGELTATAYIYGDYLLRAILMTCSFLAISAALPLPIAFLIAIFFGSEVMICIAACFAILLAPKLLRRPEWWILVWTLMSAILPFARIPQGTVVVVASLPLFVWQVVALYHQNRKAAYAAFGLVNVVAMLFLFGPLSGYFGGLMRIYADTAKVNAPWAANGWLAWGANLLKAAIIIAPLLAWVIAVLIVRSHKSAQSKKAAFAVFSMVAMYAFCLISYGFSRTDYQSSFRQYQVFLSIIPVLMIGTIVYIRTWRATLSSVMAFLIYFWLLDVLQLAAPFQVLSLPRDMIASLSVISASETHDFQNAADFGMPHVGYGKFPNGYLKESANLKKYLDRILQPDETFLDMTMVGLHYFSSQRRLLTEYPTYYTIPGDTAQFRMINKLREHGIRLSLLEPAYFDQSPSSLRAHYPYRYALLNGLPFKISEQQVLLMPPRYFDKIGEPLPDLRQTLTLLDQQFPQKDLKWLPQVWGRGYEKFKKELPLIRELDISHVNEHQYFQRTFFLNPSLSGLDAGLLVLDIETSDNMKILISWNNELGWQSAKLSFFTNGKIVIVPLDAFPRWLLSRRISSLTLRAEMMSSSNAAAPVFEINRAALMQRRMIKELGLDKIAFGQ
ncbi:hypothetical protein U14_00798 [Candidatus Moduliflexus flocculans]|uniref:Uncharacterized protein n=1 Tax=Candidatus Moduliflexus flocculans TaxID=1499966 RepID=A0A0S6VR30_9BACT|nr:hypothetical protein U14_00798 [Candidatus Moduliflexus flocculans]